MQVIREAPENDFGYERPWMYEKQTVAIFNDRRYSLVEASTKSGKTHGCIVWFLEKAFTEGEEGRHYWWVAPVSDQADIAFRRIKTGLDDDIYSANETRRTITLWNGAMLWFKSGDNPDSLYGEDVYGAVVDEASRVKEESWFALRSTLTATQASVRIIGNVKGRNNWMYRLARLAQGGHPDMYYAKITALDAAEAGIISWKEIEDAKQIYPEAVFRELYLAEPGDDEGNPFGAHHIEACTRPEMKEGVPVVWGWDVAKHTNYTVGIGLNDGGDVVRFERFQDSWDGTIARIISITSHLPAMVDSTGLGDQVVERLREWGGDNFEGFTFSSQSKQALMMGLSLMIQNREVSFPEGQITEELYAFEYERRGDGKVLYRAPRGMHDDCVDALAMAAMLMKRRHKYGGDISPISIREASAWAM